MDCNNNPLNSFLPSLPNSVMHVGGSAPPPPSADWAPPPNDWAPPPNNDWAPPPNSDWAAPPSDWAASTTDWIPPHDWAPSTEPSGQGVLPWPSTPSKTARCTIVQVICCVQ